MPKQNRRRNDLVFEELHDLLTGLSETLKQILGYNHAVEYGGITFYVNHSLVTADLTPLAFLQLNEPLVGDESEAAVERLYDRVLPLLVCRHDWIAVEGFNRTIRTVASDAFEQSSTLYKCASCTAYTLACEDAALPILGRRSTSE